MHSKAVSHRNPLGGLVPITNFILVNFHQHYTGLRNVLIFLILQHLN